jgi:GGDEF domain-containing protein
VAVAHGWLVRLAAGGSLEEAAALPVAPLAAEGPGLAAAVLRAVGSDAELARLTPLAAGAGRLAGAATPAAAAHAVAALREAAWSALAAGVPRGDGERAAALARRLGRVGDVLLQAVLRGAGASVEERVAARLAGARPFAVVAVEVEGAERLVAAGATGALRHARDAARAAAAPHEVAGEEDGRLWVVCDGDARALAARLTEAVAGAGVLDGAPLRAAAGVATWPDDGADAPALLARADERLFAARAAGVPLG